MKTKRVWGPVCSVVLAMFVFFSCEADSPDETVLPPDSGGRDTAEAMPAEPEEPAAIAIDGLVTFLVGEAYGRDNSSEWTRLDIGDAITQDMSVRVEENSYVDIQLGDFAALRLESGTTVTMAELNITSERSRATVELTAGRLLNVVEQLSGDDRYRVRTPNAVAGVRGTEFGVSATDDGRTVVGVRTGRVSVVSRELAGVEELLDSVPTEEVRVALDQVSRAIDEQTVLVDDEQITVEPGVDLFDVEDVATLTSLIRSVIEAPPEDEDALRDVQEQIRQVQTSVLEDRPVQDRTVPVTPEWSEDLDRIREIRVLPPSSSTERDSDQQERAQVTVRVQPQNADVFIDTVQIRASEFSGMYEVGSTFMLEAFADGFEPHFQEIRIDDSEPSEYQINLSPIEDTSERVPDDEDGSVERVARHLVTVRTEPPNAVITLDGRVVGRGSFSAEYDEGVELLFEADLENYESAERTVNVTDAPVETLVRLDPIVRTVQIQADPEDAVIRLGGRVVGTGRYSGEHELGEALRFEVSLSGYEGEQFVLPAGETEDVLRTVSLQRTLREISIRTDPGDAVIFVDGTRVGVGRHETTVPADASLTVRVERDGFASAEQRIDLSQTADTVYTVALQARPMEQRVSITNGMFVRAVSVAGDRIYAADRNGTVHAMDSTGRVIWSRETANSPNENSYPVVTGERVYFSGQSEFVILNAESGAVIRRDQLSSDAAHIFGRRVVVGEDTVLYPANSSIEVLDNSGELIRSLAIPEGSSMTPGRTGGLIFIADQRGSVLILDESTGDIEGELETAAEQPVALAPAIQDGIAYFVGRRGDVAAIDIAARSTVWETQLEPGRSTGSFVDPVTTASALYVFSRDTVYALRMSDGSRLFPPVSGLSAPPLVHDGLLVFGTQNGSIHIADAESGTIESRLDLEDGTVTTRPSLWNGRYVMGLSSGEIIIVNPAGL